MKSRTAAATPPARSRRWRSPSFIGLATALALCLGLVASSFGTFGVGGDEVDSLTIAQSLPANHRVDLRNQAADHPYQPELDHLSDGRIRNPHGVGNSAPNLTIVQVPHRLYNSDVIVSLECW